MPPVDGELRIPIDEVHEMAEANLKHEAMDQTLVRFNDGSGFTAQESKQVFLLQKMMFGATAQNLLEKEGLADTLLQLKSSGIFPSNLPAPTEA